MRLLKLGAGLASVAVLALAVLLPVRGEVLGKVVALKEGPTTPVLVALDWMKEGWATLDPIVFAYDGALALFIAVAAAVFALTAVAVQGDR